MSSRPLTPPPLPAPEEFRPEKFQKKSSGRDHVIYALVLITVIGVTGGSVYFFTRSQSEQDKLRDKLDKTLNQAGLHGDKPEELPKLKNPKLEGLLGVESSEAETKVAAPASIKNEPKPVAVSTYAGGGSSRVIRSGDPKQLKASAAFIQYAEALRVSSVLQGTPAKVIIAGKLYRSGDLIDETLGVTFVGVDAVKTAVILRDYSGAELRVSY